jgi:molybdopterin converting factor subunit 1
MRVFVHLFGSAREKAGRHILEVQLREPATVADLATQLLLHHTHLGSLLETAAIAVDHEFARNDTPITESSEIALLPPVSGG